MKQTIYILTILIFLGLGSFGQVFDSSFYPNGKIREFKEIEDNKIIRATTYKLNGQIKYQWDIKNKELKSFDAISYEDTLVEYFTKNCPDYTLYQHYGNGPIREIENYKAGKRHGSYQKFDRDGKLVYKGQFDNWNKIGIWTSYDSNGNEDKQIHWFHHNYSDSGISINYTIIPVLLILLVIFTSLIWCSKFYSFSKFYISYSLITLGLFLILFLVSLLASDQIMDNIGTQIGKYLFPILITMTITMATFSLIALIFKKRTGIKRIYSILFFVTSIGLYLILTFAYISSKVAGIIG